MLRAKILCSVFEHGHAYGKRGDIVTVPDHIANAFAKGAKAKLQIVGSAESSAIKKPRAKAAAVDSPKPASP